MITPKQESSGADLAPGSVDSAIHDVYGFVGLFRFQRAFEENPDWPLEQVVTRFMEHATTNMSLFFRSPTIEEVGATVVPKLVAESPGQQVSILEVGCSSGKESYSLAATILAHGNEDFRITAADINPENLAHAERGVYSWSRVTAAILASKNYGAYLADPYFTAEDNATLLPRQDSDHLSRRLHATDLLKSKIDFIRHDIFEDPVEGEFDVAIISNVLQHYPETSRIKIMGNILASLRAGGVFVIEPGKALEDKSWASEAYDTWLTSTLEPFGLADFPGHDGGTIYRQVE